MREWQLTYTGKRVQPRHPDIEVIDIRDIAHHLALENRYCGAAKWPYSVAQHSVLLSRAAPERYMLEALLHDAGEYIMRDLPKPVKDSIDTGEHTRLEKEWTKVVMKRFAVQPTIKSTRIIKWLDTRIVLDETAVLSKHPEAYREAYPNHAPLGVKVERWDWERAEAEFLWLFEKLTNNRVWYL